jgi:hypothetical protein
LHHIFRAWMVGSLKFEPWVKYNTLNSCLECELRKLFVYLKWISIRPDGQIGASFYVVIGSNFLVCEFSPEDDVYCSIFMDKRDFMILWLPFAFELLQVAPLLDYLILIH